MTRWPLLGACALLVLGLAACSEDVDASKNKRTVIHAGDEYVALGDSYTSGGYLGAETGPAGCLQTDGNYPHLLAKALDLELSDASCGGAAPKHLEQPQLIGGELVSPQLDAVTENTRLVTLSIGGNLDGIFSTVVVKCVNLGGQSPGDEPCSDLAEKNAVKLARLFDQIADDVHDAVGEILERAPEARVVVVGYPQIVPATGWCPALPLAPADYGVAREVFSKVTAALEEGADEADAEYVDVWSATQGHDICAGDPWAAGAAPDPERGGFAYHPYAEEHQVVADLLEQTVSGS